MVSESSRSAFAVHVIPNGPESRHELTVILMEIGYGTENLKLRRLNPPNKGNIFLELDEIIIMPDQPSQEQLQRVAQTFFYQPESRIFIQVPGLLHNFLSLFDVY